MATQKKDLGQVVGKDAKIASATATADATHSESPTVTVDVGGETGAQTLTFTFTGLQGAAGGEGSAGAAGKDAAIASATATVTPGHLDEPTCTVDVGGEAGAQTLAFTFAGLQGNDGAAGAAGFTPAGTSSQVVLGDGTYLDVAQLLKDNIATIRSALGVVTAAQEGLVPKLPSA